MKKFITQKRKPSFVMPKECVKVIPLGGMEEIGKNMTIFEYSNPSSKHHGEILIMDMGLQFPEENMHGIDFVVPNVDYLKDKKDKIQGVIISHGHYDHGGGVRALLDRTAFNGPLYTGGGFFDKKWADEAPAPRYLGVDFDGDFLLSRRKKRKSVYQILPHFPE